MSKKIIPHVVSQHAEEAAFLWLLRDQAVYAPNYDLPDLIALEERVEAHLDGLRVAGDDAWPFVIEELSLGEPSGAFAATALAVEQANQSWFDAVVAAVADSPVMARGMISALGWVEWVRAIEFLGPLLESTDPILRSVGIAGYVAHGRDPGRALGRALDAESGELRCRAYAAVGRLGRIDLLPGVARGFADEMPGCRYSAAWASALLGDAAGLVALRQITEESGPFQQRAVVQAGRLLEHEVALGWLNNLRQNASAARLAILAAGAIGNPKFVPWLIEQMEVPVHARIAGGAFTTITGVDLELERLEQDAPSEPAAEASAEADEVPVDPDEDYPWPNPVLVQQWWNDKGGAFTGGRRHLCGEPLSEGALRRILRYGKQSHRAAAAIELAVLGEEALFEVRARGDRQMAGLGR